MAARRAARAATRAAARSACDLDRPGRPDRSRADPAGEDVTEFDSIPAGRIDQEGPYCITDFRAVPFRRRATDPSHITRSLNLSSVLNRPQIRPHRILSWWIRASWWIWWPIVHQ